VVPRETPCSQVSAKEAPPGDPMRGRLTIRQVLYIWHNTKMYKMPSPQQSFHFGGSSRLRRPDELAVTTRAGSVIAGLRSRCGPIASDGPRSTASVRARIVTVDAAARAAAEVKGIAADLGIYTICLCHMDIIPVG